MHDAKTTVLKNKLDNSLIIVGDIKNPLELIIDEQLDIKYKCRQHQQPR